jgi:dihydroflavonol-4-reductase
VDDERTLSQTGLILVTGATGHIGNVLVRQLAANPKQRVRALVLPGEDTSALADLTVEFALGDVLDPESLADAMQGVAFVYHLAGIISILPGRNERMWQVNVEGTRNMLRAARTAGVRRLVYTSSIHALERAPHGVTIDETLAFNPANPGGEYDRTKASATLAVLEAVQDGLDAVIACPTGVIGPFDYRSSELGSLFSSWMKDRMVVLTDGIYDFTDVRDVARGLALACEHGRSGQAYILGGERTSLARLWAMVGEVAGFQAWSLFIPFSLAMAAARILPFFYRLFRQKPAFTPYSLETVRSNSVISHAKAALELGYLPRPLAETIRDTVFWWRERATKRHPIL